MRLVRPGAMTQTRNRLTENGKIQYFARLSGRFCGVRVAQRTSVHISTINAMLAGCRRHGVSPALILRRLGEDASLLENPDARFPRNRIGDLIAAIALALNDETLGFLARPTPPGGMEMWIHASITSQTLGEAMERWIRFWRMVHHEQETTLSVDGDQARVMTVFTDHSEVDRSAFVTWLMFLMVRLASWLIGKPLLLDRLCLAFDAPADPDDYADMFPCRHYFARAYNSFDFNRRFLDMPVVQSPDAVHDLVRNLPHLMAVQRVDHSLTAEVSRMVRAAGTADEVSLGCVSRHLNCSEDTIRRRLKSEGSTFSQIRESVRRDRAVYHLESLGTPINEIAYMLGFSEPSAFNRAFKRWTGQTPGDYRREVRAQLG